MANFCWYTRSHTNFPIPCPILSYIQIADLKSTNAREQREFREKMSTIQKQHNERISEMQVKIVTMQKQIASQTKGPRAPTSTNPGYVEPPMVI